MDATALTELSNTARDAGSIEAAARVEAVSKLVAGEIERLESQLDEMLGEAPSPCDLAARHLVGAGGKRVRPIATLLSALAAGRRGFDRERARTVAAAAELVHNATLLHDDVMDEGEMRRGVQTARMIHGNLVSVLAGDFLLAAALRATIALRSDPVMTDLTYTLEALVTGEVLQLRARRELILDREHYMAVARGKTASLFGWCCRSGARVAGADEPVAEALGEFGERVGVAFQLLDDVLDVAGDVAVTGKPRWADLREGKATWPVILAVESGAASRCMVRAARAAEPSAAEALAAAIDRCGAVHATRAMAAEQTAAALTALRTVPSGPARESLAAVAASLTARHS